MTGEAFLDAAREGDIAALEAGVTAGIDVNGRATGVDSALCYAVMYGHREAAEWLVRRGANVRHHGQYGRTPLHYAATKDHGLTAFLLAHGADVTAVN